jgi:hypothetical protein
MGIKKWEEFKEINESITEWALGGLALIGVLKLMRNMYSKYKGIRDDHKMIEKLDVIISSIRRQRVVIMGETVDLVNVIEYQDRYFVRFISKSEIEKIPRNVIVKNFGMEYNNLSPNKLEELAISYLESISQLPDIRILKNENVIILDSDRIEVNPAFKDMLIRTINEEI